MPADSAERRRLAVSEVRLLIKANEFHAAARLADSILRYTLATSDPLLLAGMAAVVGRPSQVAKLLSIAEPELRTGGGANPKSDPLPEAVVREASRSLAFAAFAPIIADSARLSLRRTAALIATYYPDSVARTRVLSELLSQSLSLRFPSDLDEFARLPMPNNAIYRAQWDFARGRWSAAVEGLQRTRRATEGFLPGNTSADGILAQVTLALQLGDTSLAIQQLDAVLGALPTLGVFLVGSVPQATSLIRSMLLRAELAKRNNDRLTAKRWSTAVRDLWGQGDPEVKQFVDMMTSTIDQSTGSGSAKDQSRVHRFSNLRPEP
jgi:hypothetical protein